MRKIILPIIVLILFFGAIFSGKVDGKNVGSELGKAKIGLINNLKEKIKKLKFKARISGVLETKDNSVLTVISNNKTYQVFITDTTILRPRFWGKTNVSELNLGDNLNVIGSWNDHNQTQINASLVRDLSNEKRYAVILGDVVSKDINNFVVNNAQRGNINVSSDTKTRFIAKNEKKIDYSDLKSGDRIRIKGIYDKKTNKMTEIIEVKDFSL